MQSQSRKERRAAAKKLGLLGRKESLTDLSERLKRSNEYGKMLHRLNLTEQKNRNNKELES